MNALLEATFTNAINPLGFGICMFFPFLYFVNFDLIDYMCLYIDILTYSVDNIFIYLHIYKCRHINALIYIKYILIY